MCNLASPLRATTLCDGLPCDRHLYPPVCRFPASVRASVCHVSHLRHTCVQSNQLYTNDMSMGIDTSNKSDGSQAMSFTPHPGGHSYRHVLADAFSRALRAYSTLRGALNGHPMVLKACSEVISAQSMDTQWTSEVNQWALNGPQYMLNGHQWSIRRALNGQSSHLNASSKVTQWTLKGH